MAALLEHRIPDVIDTADLPVPLAAEIDFLAGRVDRWLDQSCQVSAATSARSLAFVGNAESALDALAALDIDGLDLVDLAAACWAASRVGGPALGALLRRVEQEPAGFGAAEVPVGPQALWAGVLHGAAGNLTTAEDRLREAVQQGDLRAPLWGSLARLELARVLTTAEAVPLVGSAPSMPPRRSARTFFAAGGYRSLLERIDRLDEPVQATLVSTGSVSVGFGVQPVVTLRSSKGLGIIEYLIANTGRVVTAAELAIVLDGGDAADVAALAPEVWSGRAVDGVADSAADDVFDVSAELRRVFFDDRTRSRVTKLLRRTIDKVSAAHPLLGQHLHESVSTGYRCRYEPAGTPVAWRLTQRRSPAS